MLQHLSRKTLVTLTVLSNIIYMLWRIFFTVPQGTGWFSLAFAIGLLLVELLGMGEMFVHFYGMTEIEIPDLPEIDDDVFPHVDVLIATYNEPIDLVQKTINGCLHMVYPDKSKVHIAVCDDGSRPAMAQLCKEMGVGYIMREEHKHAKAGNLNNAMKYTTAPLLVTFDADMIPRHMFLLKTVPYFMKNEQAKKDGKPQNHPKIGFIQTPQCFYNTDLFQFNLHAENRIPNEQDYFYRDIQTAKNATNSVIYGGSNTVISRQALNDVGGFYTNSITEDFATGMLIQSKGYRCYALNTALASGLSPDDLKSLMKQRERWGRGCIQTGRRLNVLLLPGLTIGQKLSYLSSITYWYASIKRFFYIMAPILFSVFGVVTVRCTLAEVAVFWLPMFVLTNATIKKFSNNIRNTRWTNIYETIMFQALMVPVILETFGVSQNKFSVTRKDKRVDIDRDYQIKQAMPFIIYIVLSLIGIFNMLRLTFLSESAAYCVLIFWLVSNLYNLGMAALFLLGRRQLRKSDRFEAELECILTQGALHAECTTIDISEDGFALLLPRPEYINIEEEFFVTFRMDIGYEWYQASMKGKLAQIMPAAGGWKLAGYITEITPEARDKWNLIVHDRLPSQPQTIVGAMGFYDDLEVNIRNRLGKKAFFSRKTARIYLGEEYYALGLGEVFVHEFNYDYVMVELDASLGRVPNFELMLLPDVILQCTRAERQFSEKETLYHVDNLPQLMEDPVARGKIAAQMQQIHTRERAVKQQEKVVQEQQDEFNPMKFV